MLEDLKKGWNMVISDSFRTNLIKELSMELQRDLVYLFTGQKPQRNKEEKKPQARFPLELLRGEVPLGKAGRRILYFPENDERTKIIQGASGMGKTEWAINFVIERAKRELGTAYLDNTDGEAAQRILDGLPEHALTKTVVLDYSNEHYPLPLGIMVTGRNIFSNSQLMNWWLAFFQDTLGVEGQYMTQELIAYACRAAFALPNSTFLEVIEIVRSPEVRASILSKLHRHLDLDVIEWWNDFDQKGPGKQVTTTESFMRRGRLILSDPILKHMLCQVPKERYPYRKWIDEGWTVIIIARENLGRLPVRTVMTLHVMNFWGAALSRDDEEQIYRKPFVIVADEPQTWLPNNEQLFDDLFSKGRKYGLGIVCLFQNVAQMESESPRLVRIMFGNKPDLITFKCDTPVKIGDIDVSELPRYHFVAKIRDYPPVICCGLGRASKIADRAEFAKNQQLKWGQPWQTVAFDIDRRRRSWAEDQSINGRILPSERTGLRIIAKHGSRKETKKFSDSSLTIV